MNINSCDLTQNLRPKIQIYLNARIKINKNEIKSNNNTEFVIQFKPTEYTMNKFKQTKIVTQRERERRSTRALLSRIDITNK